MTDPRNNGTSLRQRDDESRASFLTRIFASKGYTLDGRCIPSMPWWIESNEIETGEALDFACMPAGTSVEVGGGAFASFTLTRTR